MVFILYKFFRSKNATENTIKNTFDRCVCIQPKTPDCQVKTETGFIYNLQ